MRLKATAFDLPEANEIILSLDGQRLEICSILRSQLGHDFSGYRSQTFLRRVERRMHVWVSRHFRTTSQRSKARPGEAALLFRDLLIRVTSFFRDKETFDTLAADVIPRLFDGKMADSTVRLWVPGCATGEEAYSLAILLREHMDSLTAAPKVQLFATDIDESAITTARLGRYPKTLVEGLDDSRRQRFFTLSQGSYCVNKEIRELCTFSMHNLIRDPPFSMMNLVSCRNLLIYMNPELQDKVIPVFHYSLVAGGILLLGGSESLAQHSGLFDTLDKKARIFLRRQGRSPELNLHWQRSQPALRGNIAQGPSPMHQSSSNSQNPVMTQPRADGAPAADRFKHLLGQGPVDTETGGHLRDAVKGLCEELQSLAEEHQTALEELRSANEELHSVNEEIQSTNEELETSKEEMQSLNEELHTVNIRLTEKVDELDHINSDLRNLFDSTQIATVFLDRHLIIRSFTPAIATVYNLIPSDQGRPLTDIVSHLHYTGFREDVAYVLQTLEPLERRVDRIDHSVHYIMRILPYREPDSSVSGVLVTFIDVSNIVKAEDAHWSTPMCAKTFSSQPYRMSFEIRWLRYALPHSCCNRRNSVTGNSNMLKASSPVKSAIWVPCSMTCSMCRESPATRLCSKRVCGSSGDPGRSHRSRTGRTEAKRHTLRVESPQLSIILEVDPVRMTQVITNLLTNAAKYTPAGGLIFLEVRLEAQFLIIAVRDNGVGLTTEAMHKVFDMFTRIESELAVRKAAWGSVLRSPKAWCSCMAAVSTSTAPALARAASFSFACRAR